MQNNSQQQQQQKNTSSEGNQGNLPGNFPRFSVQIPSPSRGNTPGNQSKQNRKGDQFTGLSKKMDSTTSRQEDDSMSLMSAFNQMEENSLNETINKELHKERNLVLQYVNSSLNDHTTYVQDLAKEIKDNQSRNKELNDKQSLMLRTQVSQIEQNYQFELEQMNQKFTVLIEDQKKGLENILYEKENRIYNYCGELEKRLDAKIESISQRLQLQLDMKDNKFNEGQTFKKLDADIQNLNNKIIQLQNLDDLTGFNSQLSTFSQEIQQIKQSQRQQREDANKKIDDMNENMKQFLKVSLNQNSNNLISNQNYKDKIFEGQIEEIQRYISGFSKVVQNRLNITPDDLNLFVESDGSNTNQQKGGANRNFPFSFGGNLQNVERVSTVGTMQSAEFEIKDSNRIVLKKDSFPSTPNPGKQKQQQTQQYQSQQGQQQQSLQNPSVGYQQNASNYQNTNQSGRMSYSPSKHNQSVGHNNSNNNNANNVDYYNIFTENPPNQLFTPQSYNDNSYSSQYPQQQLQQQQSQPQKKKKKIFGEDTVGLPPMMNSNNVNFMQQPNNRQSRNINPSPSRAQHTAKPEQKNLYDNQNPPTMESQTQRTESDQVEFATMPNKDSFQSQQQLQQQHQEYYSIPPPILDSKLSVKVNENVEVFNDLNELTDSDSDEQSTISNFRLKDTMDFIQRELINPPNSQGNNTISPFQQQAQQAPLQMKQQQSNPTQSPSQQKQQQQQQQYQQQQSQQNYQQPSNQQEKLQSPYVNQQNPNIKTQSSTTSSVDSLIKFSQLNQSSSSSSNTNNTNQNSNNNANQNISAISPNAGSAATHKRLNTIQESDQEYTNKQDDQHNVKQINNYINTKTESMQPNRQNSKHNSYEDYENFKIQMPNTKFGSDTPSSQKGKGTPRHKITNEALNFMIQSKGKSSFSQATNQQSNLPGYIQNEDADNFKPKWGFDSHASSSCNETGGEIEYQLDENGYLLDEQGQFLLDDNGQKIQLTDDNINFLAQNKMLFEA